MATKRQRSQKCKICFGLLVPSICILILANSVQAKIPMRYWTFIDPTGTGPRSIAFKQRLDAFEAKYPDIQIKVELVHWSKIDSELIKAVSAGKGPDVVRLYTNAYRLHMDAGTIVPLDPYIKDWTEQEKTDWVVPWGQTVFEGHKMYLPLETRAYPLWYREDYLNKAGISVPTNLEELAKAAAALTTDEVMGLAIGASPSDTGTMLRFTTVSVVWSLGGEMLYEDGRAAFDTEPYTRWFNYLYDLIYEYKGMGTEVLAMGAEDVLTAVKAGKVASTVEGTHRIESARAAEGVGKRLQTALPPTFSGYTPTIVVQGWSYAMTRNAKHPGEAMKFIEFMLTKEMQVINAKVGGEMVSRLSAFDDPWFTTTEKGKEMLKWKEWLGKYGRMGAFHPEFWKWSEALMNAFHEMVLHKRPADKVLSKWADWYNQEVGLK